MLESLVLAKRNVINKQQVELGILANFLGILAHCAMVAHRRSTGNALLILSISTTLG